MLIIIMHPFLSYDKVVDWGYTQSVVSFATCTELNRIEQSIFVHEFRSVVNCFSLNGDITDLIGLLCRAVV